ncbi:MAG: nicotinamide-nucleotide amidohydrolase family protein [Gammaproteobacteria bacterium]|nr:nicotinamide-nucleotide amidohydrolase family protein [Gammaproteobacteria bacterium]
MTVKIDRKIVELAEKLIKRKWVLATAESCTGGWLAKSCTDLAGSSAWFERGYVTYSNQSKNEMLGIDMALIEEHGAVSEETVGAMVTGILEQSPAHIAVAISGIAGPDGGTEAKPVGIVCFGWMVRGEARIVKTVHFDGDRKAVRRQAVEYAVNGLVGLIG